MANEVAELEALRRLSLCVAATSDFSAALNEVLKTAISMVGAAKGNVQLYNPTDDTLKIIAHQGFDEEFLECFESVPTGYSCCGTAMERRDRVIIEDVFADERFSDLGPIYARHGFLAVQSTPLFTGDGRLLGMFSTHFSKPYRPTERDLRLLDQVAQQAGRIIERTIARDELRDRQVWLDGQREALEAAVNGARLETSLAVLVRTAIEAVGQDARAGFYLANDEGTALRHVVGMPAEYAEAVDGFKVGPDSLACGLATATGQPVLTTDVRTDPLWQPWLWMAEKFDYRACWSFPIHTEARRFVGTLAIYSRQPREATDRDRELASLLTHTASIIISRHKESESRKRGEQTLRESEQRYRQLANLLPVAVYTCDARGVITYYNEQAANLWGRAPELGNAEERFCGSELLVLSNGEVLPHDQCPMAAALRDGSTFREQAVNICRPDGSEISVRVNIDPMKDSTGRIVGAINVFHDVTELIRAEQALREADRRKDEFLATLAHELRNPLAPIRSGLEVMKIAKDDPVTAEEIRCTMLRQTEQLVRLIDDLMDVSRITRGKLKLQLQQVELKEIVKSAIEATRSYIDERGHQLTISLPTGETLLEVDPHRLTQVLSNLFNNAAKYSPKPGPIQLIAKIEEGALVISVRDRGLGIPSDKLDEVFEMFEQIGRTSQDGYPGLGIGLTLAKSLVEMHGGTIKVNSDGQDQGTEFVVRSRTVFRK